MATRTTVLALAVVVVLAALVAPAAATDALAATTDAPAERVTDLGGASGTATAGEMVSTGGADSMTGSTASASTPSVVEPCAATPPADFEDPEGGTANVVGWVDGYWYDEPLDVDVGDGLTESELETLSARTAARFEAMRCLTVQEGLPPVEIVTREEFADNQSQRFTSVGERARLVDNARFETMLTIDSETDAVEVRQSDTTERVGGFYDFVANEIVIVSDEPDALSIDESVLAHELGHAIQDQHFDLAQFERPTVDRDKGILGLIEGDVHLVEHEYLGACEADEWAEPCLTDEGMASGPDIANWGLYFEEIQPYSDGPAFVQEVQTEAGWEGVNDLYADPPTSALHTTYSETFPKVEPLDMDVPDRSTDEWERVVFEDVPTADESLSHDTLGISAIAGMFAAPAYELNTTGEIIPSEAMVNTDEFDQLDRFNPHDFAHPETEGWRGDEFYTYTNAANETATVWQLAWASPEDAGPFVEAYEQLVDIRGGERVDGYASTYTFENGTGYDMAVTVVPDGDRVTVVTAPTVDALTAVDQELELLVEDGDGNNSDGHGDQSNGTDDGTDDGNDDGTDGTADDGSSSDDTDNGAEGETDDSADDAGPGFGVAAVTGATFVAALVAVVYRRREE